MEYKYQMRTLQIMHDDLMRKGFPYHSVSVIERPQDLGLHVIFTDDVKDKVDDTVISAMENLDFTHSFVKSST